MGLVRGNLKTALSAILLSVVAVSCAPGIRGVGGTAKVKPAPSGSPDSTPPVVTLTSPIDGTIINSGTASAVTFSGACSENGKTVTISGSASGSANCTGFSFSTNLNLSSLADGALTFQASQTDNAGNVGTSSVVNITKSASAPGLASVTITNSNPTNSLVYNLSYGTQSGAYTDYCILENSTAQASCVWVTAALPSSYTVSSTENAKVLSFWIKNAGGTVSSRVDSNSVTLDTTAPTLASATVTNPSPTNDPTFLLTYGAQTGTYSQYCILENDTTQSNCVWTAGTLPTSFTVTTTNNAKVLSIWIKDAAGNVSTPRVDTNSVTLDTGAPTLASATVTNTSPTNSTTYNLTYGAQSGSYSHYCILENSTTQASCTWTAGVLPSSYTVSSTENAKVLSIWIRDAAGNISTPRVDTNSVTLDTTAPTLASATVTNTSPTNTTTYNLSFGAQTGTYSHYCILENDTTQSNCTWVGGVLPSSYTVTGTNNAKVLSVWIKDVAGNISSPRVDTNSVTLDTSVPTLASATVTNTSPTNSTTYNLTYGAQTGAYSDYCILENDTTQSNCTWTAGALPASFTVSATENAKVLSIWIKDSAGNVSTPRVDTNSVTLDSSAPTLASATVTNSSPTNSTTYNLTYGAQTGSYTHYCILENDTTQSNCTWTAGVLPASFAVSATENAKVLSIWIKDGAGNISTPRVDTNSVTLDTTAPTLASITVTNTSPTNTTTYNLTYGAQTGSYSHYCILENDTTQSNCTWTAGALPSSFTVSATNNAKVLSVWIKDAAGNISTPRRDSNSVTLDTNVPTLASATVTNTSPTNSTTYNLSYGAQTGTYSDYCILENDTAQSNCSWTAGALPSSYTVTATENAKVLSIWIKNSAGNVSTPRVDTNSVTLDTTAPTLASITVTNTSPTGSTTYNLTYGAQTGSYSHYCILENDTTQSNCTWTAGALPSSFTVSSTENAKVLSVWIKDAAGNISTPRRDSNSVTLDTSAPTLASASVTNTSPTNSTTYNLTYGAQTGTYSHYCILENDTTQSNCTWTSGALPASYTVSATENAKVLSIWIKDASGNVSTPRVDTNSVTLDTTAPTLASATVGNSSPTGSTVYNLSYGAQTGTYSHYCILENDTTQANCTWTAGALPSSFTVSSTNNAKVLSLWIKDAAGNVSSPRVDTNSVTLDTSVPTLASATVTNTSPTNTTTYNLTYGAQGGTYTSYCILENDTTQSNCSWTAGALPASFAVSATENAKVLSIWIKNAAGNVSTPRVDTNSVTLDTTAPTLASVTVTNADPTSSTTYNLTFGSQTGTYSHYCILENDTTQSNCVWQAGALPSSFVVSSVNNAKVLSVWLKDTAGNVSTPRRDSNSVTLNTTAPGLASATVTNTNPTNSLIYNLTYGTQSGSYTDYCILENDTTQSNCSWQAGVLPSTYTVSATENAKILSIWIKDAINNVSSRVDTNSVTLDTTAPTLASVSVTNTSPTNSTTYNLSYGAQTGTYSHYCILENDTTLGNCTWTAGALPATFTVASTENAKVLSVWIKDGAGNVSTPRRDSNSVTLDTSAPTLASASVTNTSPTNTTTYNLSYGAQTGTYSHYCILENDTTVGNCSWTAGALPASFVVSSTENAKVLSIWIKDTAGNISTPRVDTNSVTYDVTAPTLASATVTNTSPTNSTTYNLTYGAQTGTYTHYCILENDTVQANCTWTAGTLPTSFAVSATNNAKVLSVWIKDGAGNVSTPRVDTNSVTLDTSAPTLASATVTNTSPTSSTTYNLSYGAQTGSYSQYCILENDTTQADCSWTNGALPATFTVSSTENAKVLSIWLKDTAGNVSAPRVDTNSVTLDTGAPTLASATVTNTSPTGTTVYNLSYGTQTGTYSDYCILENDTTQSNCSWTAGALPSSYTVTATENAKVLSIWLKDSAGNISTPRVDTNSVTLDTTAPTLASITISNTSPTNTTSYSLSYGAQTGSYSHYCILENDTTQGNCTWTAGALPGSFTVSATENAKVLSVWIKDSAGNISSPRRDSNSVTLDTTAPTLASASVTNTSPTNTTTYGLSYGAQTGTYSHYCILENDTTQSNCSWTAGALPASKVVSATENAKVLSIWIKDAAGNVSTPRVDTNSVTLDSTGPTLASATVTNTSPTSSTTYNLTYGAQTGSPASYCILENDTTIGNCAWTAGALPASFTVSATENAKVLSIWTKDAAGNVSSPRVDTNSVTLDTSAPTLASASVTNTSPTSSTTYNLSYGAQTGTYSHYCILENDTTQSNCSWTAGALPASYAVSATENAKVLSIWIKDSAGNVSTPRVDTNSVTLDTTGPTLASASVSNTSPTNTQVYGLSYGAQTGTYSHYCILENDTVQANCTWTAGALPASYSVTATNNAKVLSIWIKDSAGNISTPRVDTNSVTLDTAAPTLASAAITNTDPTNTTSYGLSYGAQTGTYSHYCILENDTTQSNCSWTAGALPTSFTVSATNNAKVLSVWIKDSAGNISAPRVDTNSVTLDTSGPTLASVTVTNSSPTNTTTYSLSYGTQSGAYTQYCILENDTTVGNCSWTTAALPASFAVSATENAKVLSVWIKNAAGTVFGPVNSNSVTLDTTAPTLASATVGNTSPTNTTTYTLSYGAQTGTYSHYCILENDTVQANCTWTAGTLPASKVVSATENAKVLSVWIKDAAGNISTPRVDTNSVTLDTSAPTLASATVTNSSPTNTTSYALSYGAQTGTYSHYCILENDTVQANCSWTAGALPASFTVSATENAKVLSIWIKDSAGNISTPRVDTNSVTLDTTVPTLASASVTNTSPTNSTSYGLSYGAQTGTYSHYCILENDTTQSNCSWTAGALPASYTVSATENAKVLSIWIKDSAGNVSTPRVDTNSVTLDTTAPTLASATVTNSDPTNTTSYALSYGAQTGTYSHYCILENDTVQANCTWTAGALPASFTVSLTNNAKVLSVWIKDAAGNISTPRRDTNSVTLDTSGPTLASVTVTNSSPTNTLVYSLSYGTQNGAYTQYCILENDTTVGNCSWTAGALPASYSVSATENAKILSVWIKNGAGTTFGPVNSNSVTLDTTAPTLASASITNTSPTNTTTYGLSYGAQTGTYSHYCILENDTVQANCTWTAGALPASQVVSATENAKVLSIWIKDAAGNISTPRVDTGSVTLDTTAPTLASASITNTSPTNTTTYGLSYGAQTGTYSHYCILENDTVQANCTWTAGALPASTVVSATENAKVLSIWIKDSAGNISTPRVDTGSVTLDTTAPTLASVTVTNTSPTNSTSYGLTYGSQTGSYSHYCILENDTTQSNCTWTAGVLPASFTVSSTENAKVLSVWIKDSAGNVSTPRRDSNSVTLDTTPPTLASASISNTSPTNTTTYNLSYGAQTGSPASYCILENDTVQANCSWTAGALPASYSVTSTNNAKVLSIWTKDAAGNISTPRVDTNSVTLDNSAPTLASASVTNTSPTNTTTYSLSYGAQTGTYSDYCILENDTVQANCTWTAGALPASFAVSSTENAKVLSIWIKDSAGNISAPRVDTNSVTLDTSAPTLASASVTNTSPTNSTTYALSYGAQTGSYSHYCILENDTTQSNCSWTAGTLPASVTVSSTENAKVLSIWIKDSAGNISTPRVDTNSVTLDTTAPTLASASVTNTSPTNTTTYSLSYGAQTGTYSHYCILENDTTQSNCSWTAGALPASKVVSATENAKVLSIWIKDAAGNISTPRVDTNSVTLDSSAPTLASASVTNTSPTNTTTYGLSYGAQTGTYSHYCILENDTTIGNCSWTAGALPASKVVSATENAKVLSIWIKDSAGNISTPRVDTNSVTLDTTPPTLASASVTNTSPTNTTTYNLSYGAETGSPASYCILENDTTVGNCSWTAGALPSTFTVSSTNNAKVLSIWTKDAAGNISTPRVDTNSVTYDNVAPTLASASITNTSPTNTQVYGLSYGAQTGTYSHYCILENDTTQSNCTWTAGALPASFSVSATENAKVLSIWIKDSAGNISTPRVDTGSVTLDTTAPTLASASVTNTSPTNSTTYNLSYGAQTGTYSHYCILENDTVQANCSWTAGTLPTSKTVSATENAKVLSIWIKDSAGNISTPRVDTNSVTLDTTPPTLASASVGNTSPTNTQVYTLSYGSQTGTYSHYCINENDTVQANCTWVAGTLPASTTVSSTENAKVLSIWIKDSAGNVSTPRVDTNSVTLDTSVPTLASASITNTSPTNSTTYGLSYGAQTGTYSHYCILENDTVQANCSWTAGALPASKVVSATENSKVLSIWIKDAAGNISTPRVDTGSVTLDTTPPTLASAAVTNSDPTGTTTYTMSYGAQGGSPASYCILENDTTVGNCSWTAGALPATFTVSSTNNAKILSVWTKDSAGNISTPRRDTNSVTLDTAAPTLASASVTNSNPSNTQVYSLSYGAQTGTYSHYCILENDTTQSNCSWTAGALPASYSVTATNNAKVLSIWIKDSVGNISTPRVDTASVTLDTSAPTLASVSVTNSNPTGTTTYSLSYGAQTGTYSHYCILENDTVQANCSWTAGALPASYTVSSTNNAKVLSVWIKDSAGNISTPRVDSNSVTLDTTPPTLASASVSNTSPTNTLVYSLSYGSQTGTYSHYCILENDTTQSNCVWQAGALPASYSVSATNNAKVLSIWIKDSVGNVSTPRVDTNSVTLDTSVPTLASASITNSSPSATTTYNLSYGSQTGTYSHYCILENDTTQSNCSWTSGALPTSFVVSTTQNAKVLSIWIKDSAGNISTPRVDTNSVTYTPGGGGTATKLAFSVQPSDAAATVAISPSIKVQIQDSGGSIVSGATDNITLAIGTNPGGADLGGTLTVAAVAGEATFSNITLNQLGTGYILKATSGSLTAAYSSAFNITGGSATKAVFLSSSSTTGHTDGCTGPFTLEVEDANSIPSNSSLRTFTLAGGGSGGTTFYTDSGCGTTTTTVSIAATATRTSFYLRHTLAETFAVSANDGAALTDPSMNVTISNGTGGLTLQNPIDIITGALYSDTPAGTKSADTSDQYYIDPADFDGSPVFTYEVVATNTDSSPRAVTLYNASTTTDVATVNVPANTTNYTRFVSTSFTPTAAWHYMRMDKTTNSGQLTVAVARILVTQTNATKTRIFIPLYTDSIDTPDAISTTSIRGSTTGTTMAAGPTMFQAGFKKDTTKFSSLAATTPWRLEGVIMSSSGTRTTTAEIYANGLSTTAAITTTSTTAVAVKADFSDSISANFSNGSALTLWQKSSNATATATVYGAHLSVLLNSLSKAEVYYRILSGTGSNTGDNTYSGGRMLWNPSLFSAPVAYLDAISPTTGGTTETVKLKDDGTGDAYTGSPTTIESVSSTGTATFNYYRSTNAISSMVASHQYTIGTQSTGFPSLQSAGLAVGASQVPAPTLASATVTNSSPTTSMVYNLTYGAITGQYSSYCILENSTTVGSCSWVSGTLPTSYTVSSTQNAKVLSIWLKNVNGVTSTRVDTNSVTLDLSNSAPLLASFNVTTSSPTNTLIWNVSWGAITGSYTDWCILESASGSVPASSGCSWSSAALPSTYTVSGTNGTRMLTAYLRNANGVSPVVSSAGILLDTSGPVITITQPNGGETLTGGNSYNITYSISDAGVGVTSTATIEYSRDGGSTWQTLTTAGTIGASQTYSWTIYNVATAQGRIRISTTDSLGNSSQTTSASNFTVNYQSLPATAIAFVQNPTNANAGSVISPNITVQAVDATGAPVASGSSNVTLTVTGGGATVLGTATRTQSSGLATFNDINITKAGTYTLTATQGALTAQSSSFTIAPLALSTLAFNSGSPTSGVLSTCVGPFTIEKRDTYANVITTGSVSGNLNKSSGSGTLTYYASSDTTCTGGAITTFSIGSGTSSFSFYIKHDTAETVGVRAQDGTYNPVQNVSISVPYVTSIMLGFEIGNVTNAGAVGTTQGTGVTWGTQVGVTTTDAYTGRFGLFINSAVANWAGIYRNDQWNNTGTGMYVSTKIKYNALTGLATAGAVFIQNGLMYNTGGGTSSSTSDQFGIGLNSSGNAVIYKCNATTCTVLTTGTNTYSASTWYTFQIGSARSTSTTVTAKVYSADGVTLHETLTATAQDVQTYHATGPGLSPTSHNMVARYNQNNQTPSGTANIVYDDMVADYTMFPSPKARIYPLNPNAAGSNSAWTGTYSNVSDMTANADPDVGGTSVDTATLNNTSTFAMENPSASGVVLGINLISRWVASTTGAQAKFVMLTGGSAQYRDDTRSTWCNSATATTTNYFYRNAPDGASLPGTNTGTWDTTNLTSLEVGAQLTTAGGATCQIRALVVEAAITN